MSQIATGTVAFSNLTEFDIFKGKSTGRYSLTVVLDEDSAERLGAQGIKLKDYEGNAQRKFTSKFNVDVLDMDDEKFVGEVPRGSLVRVLFQPGEDDAEYGPPCFLNKVRVVEAAETFDTPEEF